MKDENFINIQWWMINKLKLQWNELILYAIIYWFSQDWKSKYRWSITYIQKALWVSRNTAIWLIKKLLNKWLIEKEENNTWSLYTANNSAKYGSAKYGSAKYGSAESELLNGAESELLNGAESEPNIYKNNNKNNNKNNKTAKNSIQENELLFEKFWDNYPNKKTKQKAKIIFMTLDKNNKLKAIEWAKQYALEKKWENKKFIKHPTTWLNWECWHDEPDVVRDEEFYISEYWRLANLDEAGKWPDYAQEFKRLYWVEQRRETKKSLQKKVSDKIANWDFNW